MAGAANTIGDALAAALELPSDDRLSADELEVADAACARLGIVRCSDVAREVAAQILEAMRS